ncbi:MAG: 2-oxoacid:acceptor oxidoreductase subunit alpha [Planctomycetota bacterium]|nr:2-oxoacid:acceptor oxidoreductase subunit alpha [Planctomycetota bacterium]
MTTIKQPGPELPLQQLENVVIRFAGDSGDGMQITGNQFTLTSALVGNDLATLPDFPAEIRAPVGTRPGVSGFQLQFSANDIHTPGDAPDVLVAMNPAALAVNLGSLNSGGIVVVNTGSFKASDLRKAKLETNPLEDGSLDAFRVIPVDINQRVLDALADSELSKKDKARCKNFYTLGLMYWVYSRPLEPTMDWLAAKFAKKPELVDANQKALQAGYNAGDIHELFQGRYEVPKTDELPAGTYRNINGNQAVALGVVAGAQLAGLVPVLGSYPITPASTVLEELAALKRFGVITMQLEDEIAAVCAAIGASFAGCLGVTSTSGPGMALKGEAMGLAVSAELPLVILDIQRAGPSTGMPTKVEQSDLLQSVFGRNGDTPMPVVAVSSPADALDVTIEACRIAVEFMTPVILLSDNFIANGSEPWLLPDPESLKKFPVQFTTDSEGHHTYMRDEKGSRPWVKAGTPDMAFRIGGLEKDIDGNISYDPDNHQSMTDQRHQKVLNVADTYPSTEVVGEAEGDLLVIGWGSSKGIITQAVTDSRQAGRNVSRVHLRNVWPLPKDLDEILTGFKAILVPEMNVGQMARVLRSEMPHQNFISYSKVTGQPFLVSEITDKIATILEN